jgi:splicing factor 3A subunit 3
LLAYLESFFDRSQPLQSLEKLHRKAEEAFEEKWAAGGVAGWEDRGRGRVVDGDAAPGLDIDAFDSVEELEQLGGWGSWGGQTAALEGVPIGCLG